MTGLPWSSRSIELNLPDDGLWATIVLVPKGRVDEPHVLSRQTMSARSWNVPSK